MCVVHRSGVDLLGTRNPADILPSDTISPGSGSCALPGNAEPLGGRGSVILSPSLTLEKGKGKPANLALGFTAKTHMFGIARECIYLGIMRSELSL